LEAALHKAVEAFTSVDLIREEILLHTNMFRDLARGFVGKSRLVNKLVSFFTTRYRFGIPPLVVHGPKGMGKSRLICQALHKYLLDAVPMSNASPAASHAPIIVVRLIGASAESSTSLGLLKSICRQIRRAHLRYQEVVSMSASNVSMDGQESVISPDEDPDYVPGDFSSLESYFKALLRTASPKRPIIIALLGIDKFDKEDVHTLLPWLPIKDNAPYVYIAMSISDSETNLLESMEARHKTAEIRLNEARLETFGDFIISIDNFDIPSCHVALNRWGKVDGHALTASQRKAVVSSLASGPNVTPQNVRLLYKYTQDLHSWVNPPSITVESPQKLVDMIFDMVENTHGKVIMGRVARILCLIRDGTSEGELEDLLSIDAAVLSESIAHQLDCASPLALTKPTPIPRVSSIAFVSLLRDLQAAELVSVSRGICTPLTLYKWSSELVREIGSKRYLTDIEVVTATSNDIVNYFSAYWVLTTTGDTAQDRRSSKALIGVKVEVRRATDYDSFSGTLYPHSLLPQHPTSASRADESTIVFNARKLRVLPRLMVLSQRWKDLRHFFEDFLVLEGLIETQVCFFVI
jgi:hypothetical protein